MSMSTTFRELRWRIIRHGPNDERWFSLIAGLVAAAGVVALAAFTHSGAIHSSWVTVAVSVFGLTWLFGPILLPGSTAILDPMWFRTLPQRGTTIARAMTASEAIGVGTVITAVALSSLVVLAAADGLAAVGVAIVTAIAQLVLLLWLGRCASAVVARLLRSTFGLWVAAFQMSVLLALSFAGWVPLMAAILPDLGEGRTEFVSPPTHGAVPAWIENSLLILPTGWGLAAVHAATSQASVFAVAMPIVGLVAGGILLRRAWIQITAMTLRQPPARMQSNVTVNLDTPTLIQGPRNAAWAVTVKELKTWLRDPHRKLGLAHAWFTPLLMILLVAPTNWSWALPFIGVAAAVLAAMVAVNTYALDGTAIWQLITTPQAIRADVRGRQQAWMLLFGIPILGGTVLLCLFSQSPLWAVALGMTLTATGASCVLAPLFSALMPAIGADARQRISSAQDAGNAGGGQWTIFTAAVAAAVAPVVIAQLSGIGSYWLAHLTLGIACAAVAVLILTPATRHYLERTAPALLSAMASGGAKKTRSQELLATLRI
ncbi:MAG TPA: hypothetical protein VKY62_01365 [Devosia sp.]|nr:hypothetical protein [Devosia sp.]